MENLLSDKPVLVTGATGFIALHVIEMLLNRGYKVRGTCRSLEESKIAHIRKLDTKGTELELIKADLTTEGSFDDACIGVEYVLHIASPFMMDVKDPQKELVDPAVKGTLNILNACEKSGSVKCLVITSSIAAMTDSPDPKHVYTESDWNKDSSLNRNPYYFSKKLAEETAWKFVKEKSPKFKVSTINPSFVFGPGHKKGLSESQQVLHDIMTGKFPVMMDLHWATVDVRDVAKAHLLAMEKGDGRYICSNEEIHFTDMCKLLNKHFPGYSVPTTDFSGWFGSKFMYLASLTQPHTVGTYIRTNLGQKYRLDNSKIKKELEMEFCKLEDTVIDTIKWFISTGQLEDKGTGSKYDTFEF